MKNFITDIIKHENCVTGIDINILSNAEISACQVTVSKKAKNADIINSQYFEGSLDEYIEQLNNKYPVILSLNGKGVIHKENTYDNPDNPNLEIELFKSSFLNVKLTDFNYQVKHITGNQYYLSIIRKDFLDNLIEKFRQKGVFVIGVSLGPFIINDFNKLIQTKVLLSNYYKIHFSEDNTIRELISNDVKEYTDIKIADNLIKSNLVVPFLLGLNYYIKSSQTSALNNELADFNKEEILYKNLFNKIILYALFSIFIILILNFTLFSRLSKKNTILQSEVNQVQSSITVLNTLKKETALRKGYLNNHINEQSGLSLFSDQIAASVPENIFLTEMNFNPLVKRIKTDSQIEFETNKLIIKGLSRKISKFKEWTDDISKNYSWIKEVNVLNYQEFNNENAEFNIQIEFISTKK